MNFNSQTQLSAVNLNASPRSDAFKKVMASPNMSNCFTFSTSSFECNAGNAQKCVAKTTFSSGDSLCCSAKSRALSDLK